MSQLKNAPGFSQVLMRASECGVPTSHEPASQNEPASQKILAEHTSCVREYRIVQNENWAHIEDRIDKYDRWKVLPASTQYFHMDKLDSQAWLWQVWDSLTHRK